MWTDSVAPKRQMGVCLRSKPGDRSLIPTSQHYSVMIPEHKNGIMALESSPGNIRWLIFGFILFVEYLGLLNCIQ